LAMRTTISANTATMKGEKKTITNNINTDHPQTAQNRPASSHVRNM
jgi:hypothetical protein